MRISDHQKGVLLMLTAAFLLSGMQLMVNFTDPDIGVMEQVFARNSVSLFIALIICRRKKLSYAMTKGYRIPMFLRSFTGWLGIYVIFYAARHADQGDVAILSKLHPFLILILSTILLKERISKMQIPAVVLALAGGFISASPTFSSDWFPLLMAFLNSVLSAVAYTFLRYFKGKVDPMLVVCHFSCFSMLASIPFMLPDFHIPSPHDLLILLLIGCFGSFGQITLTYGFTKISASEGSIYNQTGIIFSMLMGFLFLNQVPQPSTITGALLVFAATFLLYWYNSRHLDQTGDAVSDAPAPAGPAGAPPS